MCLEGEPLISVVVPIYNVEQYLEKCINSIRNQTYKNLEIILVNDGSTDNCGTICDQYASIDSRIKVIHKKNGGLSDARNKGIDIAKGDFLAFIDSDDTVMSEMMEKLYKRIETDQSDMAFCGYLRINQDGIIVESVTLPDMTLSGFDALKTSYANKGVLYTVAWNKLYKRKLFETIRYPLGKYHEDEFTTYRVIDQCETISIINDALYLYVQRENSITGEAFSVRRLDGIEASYERYCYFKRKGGKYNDLMILECDTFTPMYFQSKQLFVPQTPREKEKAREIDHMAKMLCFDGFGEWSLPRKIKLISPRLYLFLGKNKKVIKRETKLIAALARYLSADSITWENTNMEGDGNAYLILSHENSGAGIMTELLTVLGWLRYAIQNGYILIVNMSTLFSCYDQSSRTKWEDYYEQPMLNEPLTEERLKRITSDQRYAICQVGKTRYNLLFYGRAFEMISRVFPPKIQFPMMRDYKMNTATHKEFCDLYRQYIHFNPRVQEYIENEYRSILWNKGVVLGVIVRGTDYVQLKPYRHPIQPPVQDIIEKAKELRKEKKWDFLYLATEEKAVENQFNDAFPGRVLVNKRQYYDGNYNDKYLFEVRNDRENDQYLRNLEYLSSMYLLSKCNMLIGGMCGGSQGVLIMRGGLEYEYLYLFDLGDY